MSKVLITGAAGFLGSHLAERLLADGHEVLGVADNLLGGRRENLPADLGPHLAQIDCCDLEKMTHAMGGVEVVFHLAAAPHEGLSVFSPTLVTRNTYQATVATATAAIRNGVRRFVFTSSMARYGKPRINFNGGARPFDEDDRPMPVDPYGVAKVAAEQTLNILGKAHGMEVVTIVPHNVYGPRQRYNDPFRNVVGIFMNLMLMGRQPIIYGDGQQMRSFTYVDDFIEPTARAAFAPVQNVDGQVFNVGPDDRPVSVLRLAQVIAEALDFKLEPVFKPDRPCEVKKAWPSAAKAKRMLGVEAKVPLEEGVRRMACWMKEQGPRDFLYHLPLEIVNASTPETWAKKLF